MGSLSAPANPFVQPFVEILILSLSNSETNSPRDTWLILPPLIIIITSVCCISRTPSHVKHAH